MLILSICRILYLPGSQEYHWYSHYYSGGNLYYGGGFLNNELPKGKLTGYLRTASTDLNILFILVYSTLTFNILFGHFFCAVLTCCIYVVPT